MPTKTHQLSQHILNPDKKYFLDANIWINYLSNPNNPTRKEQTYINFFEGLINKQIQIYSHSLVISEVMNAMLRIAFKAYKKNLKIGSNKTLTNYQIDNLDYKKSYRNTDDFKRHFSQIKSDIEAYSPYVILLDSDFSPNLELLMENIPSSSDFNDYFYHEMGLLLGLTIVTDDGDFSYPDIEILTENKALLRI